MTTREPLARLVRHQLRMRMLRVLRTERLNPTMVRVTLHGDDLDGFTSMAPDDHVKLFFPAVGQERPALPSAGPTGLVYPEGEPRPEHRDYTPRRYRAEQRELDIDFVIHGEGPASAWAAHAEPGMYLGVAGPRGSFVVDEPLDWIVLAGDATALPAIGRTLEELPERTRAFVFAEVESAAQQVELATRANVAVTWLHPGAHGAGRAGSGGADGDLLLPALRGLTLPEGEGYLWAAGEASVMQAVRTHLRDERGLDPGRMKVRGYWKRGVTDHQEPHSD